MTEQDFRDRADAALDSLKQSLYEAEEDAAIEVEESGGALQVNFENGARFVVSPNAPVKQIWISALSTSFKLDWSSDQSAFVLEKSGETLKVLIARLINQQLGSDAVALN